MMPGNEVVVGDGTDNALEDADGANPNAAGRSKARIGGIIPIIIGGDTLLLLLLLLRRRIFSVLVANDVFYFQLQRIISSGHYYQSLSARMGLNCIGNDGNRRRNLLVFAAGASLRSASLLPADRHLPGTARAIASLTRKSIKCTRHHPC